MEDSQRLDRTYTRTLGEIEFYLNYSDRESEIHAVKIQVTREPSPIYPILYPWGNVEPRLFSRGARRIIVTPLGGMPRTANRLVLVTRNEHGVKAKLYLYSLRRIGMTNQWTAVGIAEWKSHG